MKGNFQIAIKIFERCIAIAEKYNLQYHEILNFYNISNCLCELKNFQMYGLLLFNINF